MTFNPDDPKWTAYVLGELEDSDRAEMDSLLESSEDARAYMEELRVAAGALEHELKVELKFGFPPEINAALAGGLNEAQRAAIHAAAGMGSSGAASNIRWFKQPPKWVSVLAVAAMITLAIGMPVLWKSQQSNKTASAPTSSAGALKKDQGIPSSPAIPAADGSKLDRAEQTAASKDARLASQSDSAKNPLRSQSPENTSPAPSPQGGLPAAPVLVMQPVELERGKTVVGNSIITDVFPPLVPPAGAAGAPAAGTAGIFNLVQNGTISGTVTDPTGALMPGVTVTATNTESGVTSTALSNDSGAYNFVRLAPGPYRLTATLGGFQTAMLVNINLGAADTQRFDIAMKLGDSTTRDVALAIETPQLIAQSSASSVGQALNEQRVRDLPLVGADVLNLLFALESAEKQNQSINGLQALSGQPGQQGQQGQQGQGGQAIPTTRDRLQVGQGQQGQQVQQGRQAGPSVGPGAASGVGAGVATGRGGGGAGRGGAAAPPAMGAPPPPPPPPASAAPRARIIPDNPTTLDGIYSYDRRTVPNTASYAPIIDNPFLRVSQEPLSTFSSDVDTASYANLRRFITQNQLPPASAVRIEEMINYFPYDYAQPSGKDPIGASMEIASAPWSPTHRLVRIGIKARDIDTRRRPSSNLVFLIDVSGSMQPQERLPLIKNGLKMLVGSLTENDHVSMVVYAGTSGVVLPSTSGNRKDLINAAIDRLAAGGSTNGGAGIQQAYQIATSNFIPGGVNRVILATDGDFNVGITDQAELTRLIQDRAKSGVFLSVLGVGTDNLKDATMERLADTGNGNYAYLDSLNEAYKVLVEQMSATLVTVAKDVKLQVEFNPAVVEAYRLIGYEDRLLANADFNNDRKDAGDMGAGHSVTALYEIIPRGGAIPGPDVDPLKYQTPTQAPAPVPQARNSSSETLTLKIRYKDPDGTESKLLSLPLTDREGTFARAGADFRFAASVAEFGMILRNSPYRGKASVGEVIENAQASKGQDRNGYRQEFIQLVQRARSVRGLE